MPPLLTWLLLAHAAPAAPDPSATYELLCARVAAAYDSSRGGFVTREGVPSESAVELAFARAREAGDRDWRRRAVATASWTRALLDTLSGGYFHGAASAEEGALGKRADVNARRLELSLTAAAVTGDSAYRADAANIADFVDRVLLDGRGGFVSAQVGDREPEPASNGVAIRAWLSWAAHRGDRRVRDFGLRSIDRVWEICWTPEIGLVRRTFGVATSYPLLADQVEMGRACVRAARMCGRDLDSRRARQLGDVVLARYEDRERGGFRTMLRFRKDGSARKAPREHGENARAALFLAELAALTGESRYRDAALRAAASFEHRFAKLGLEAADWALAMRMVHEPVLAPAVSWPKATEVESAQRKKAPTADRGSD